MRLPLLRNTLSVLGVRLSITRDQWTQHMPGTTHSHPHGNLCLFMCKQEAIQQTVKVEISCVHFSASLHTHFTGIKLEVTQIE